MSSYVTVTMTTGSPNAEELAEELHEADVRARVPSRASRGDYYISAAPAGGYRPRPFAAFSIAEGFGPDPAFNQVARVVDA